MLPFRWLPLLLPLLLLLPGLCSALDPFAMFESEMAPPPSSGGGGGDCCAEAGRCRRLLDAMGPLRARWATRRRFPAVAAPRPADRREVNSAFMQRHVRRTLKLFHLDEDVPPAERETFLLRARITEIQVMRLRQFVSGAGHISLVEADSILEEVLAESELESLLAEGRPRWLRRLTAMMPGVSPELLPLLAAAALAVWLLLALLVGRSWGYVISRLTFLLLVLSFFWHWNHLYKRAQAERHLQFNPPQGCEASDRGWSDGLFHYVRGMVSFVKPDEVCREYYTKLHVDPFTEVSPGLAMTEMLTKMVLHPAEQFGRALGRFYGALAAEVPTLWLIPLTVVSLVFILALVIIACRCLPSSSGSDRGAPVEPLHVTVTPGRDTVYLVVTAEGEVQPVGEEAHRRTTVQRAGPEKVGWLAWTGRGLVRSVSAGALVAGGVMTVGRRALLNRRLTAPPPPPQTGAAVMEVEAEAEVESPSAAPSRARNPQRPSCRDSAMAEEPTSTGRVTSAQRPAASVFGDGVASGGNRPVPTADALTSPGGDDATTARPADGRGGSDRQAIAEVLTDPSPERSSTSADTATAIAATPVKSACSPVTSAAPPMTSLVGGGDAGSPAADQRRPVVAAEAASRGGGDEGRELTASPFLTRIKEVMDTSLEEKEG